MTTVLLDTGPLVALIDRCDAFHDWARERFAELREPVWTCEAVLAEACHLSGRAGDRRAPLDLVARGVIAVAPLLDREHVAVRALMVRYADVPMALADACLVRMSEQHTDPTVLTLDRDFRVYRRHGRQPLRVVCPR